MLVGGVFTLLSFVGDEQANMPCKALVVELESNNMRFVEIADVKERLTDLGSAIEGDPMSSLDLRKFEEEIRSMPEVEDTEVYSTIDGKVVVQVKQRRPIVRVINQNDSLSVYIDDRGQVMPWSRSYTARVLVVNGHLNIPRSGAIDGITAADSGVVYEHFKNVYKLANYIDGNDFWKDQIIQVYVTPQGEYELIPLVGGHKIIFGTLENMKGKFNKLELFYEKGLKNADWNKYRTVNLKYKDQIVCTKKINS